MFHEAIQKQMSVFETQCTCHYQSEMSTLLQNLAELDFWGTLKQN